MSDIEARYDGICAWAIFIDGREVSSVKSIEYQAPPNGAGVVTIQLFPDSFSVVPSPGAPAVRYEGMCGLGFAIGG